MWQVLDYVAGGDIAKNKIVWILPSSSLQSIGGNQYQSNNHIHDCTIVTRFHGFEGKVRNVRNDCNPGILI